MAEYIERETLLRDIEEAMKFRGLGCIAATAMERYIKRQTAADVVSRGAYEQVRWERDVAIEQLRTDYGVGLGEKKHTDVVEVVHGRNLKDDTPSLFECSVCHWCSYDTLCGDTEDYNYCPNCGARMDGGKDAH